MSFFLVDVIPLQPEGFFRSKGSGGVQQGQCPFEAWMGLVKVVKDCHPLFRRHNCSFIIRTSFAAGSTGFIGLPSLSIAAGTSS